MNTDQLLELLHALQRQSTDIHGTVLATDEGFVLTASGQLNNETAAATCVHISEVVQKHLSVLYPAHYQDMLVWSDNALWYILRIDNHVLMTMATLNCNADTLRLVTRNIAERIAGILMHDEA